MRDLPPATKKDTPPYPDSNSNNGDDTRVRPNRGSPPKTPRWVKVSGIIVIVLVLLYVALELSGAGGGHGPGRHTPSGDVGGQIPPSSVTEAHSPPSGGHR
jgi:hypothetical protein